MDRLYRLLFGVSVIAILASVDVAEAQAQNPIQLNGMGVYCSMTWPNGVWHFAYGSGGDPCQWLTNNFGGGGEIRHKGIYSLQGSNNVVLQCDDGSYGWQAGGDGAIQSAFNEAKNKHLNKGCVFTVTAKEMPILQKPYTDADLLAKGYEPSETSCAGLDYARGPYNTLDALVPLPGGGMTTTSSKTVNNKRRVPLSNGGDDPGQDCGLPKDLPLRAMGDGVVVQAWCWDSGVVKPNPAHSRYQQEVILEHTVVGPHPSYTEKFYTIYAHLGAMTVKTGDSVKQGTQIGTVGWNGNSSWYHLHFSVNRRSNTVDKLLEPFTVNPGSLVDCANPSPTTEHGAPHNLDQMIIDPYGWQGQDMFDPWATGGASAEAGATSVNLWQSGKAPNVAPDWLFQDGIFALQTTTTFGKCVGVANASTSDGAAVGQWACDGTNAQRWVFKKTGITSDPTSLYEIRNYGSGKCLDVSGGSTATGAGVQQWSCNGTAAQKWAVTADSKKRLVLRPQTTTNRCLHVENGGATNGTKLQQWSCNDTAAQRFKFQASE